MADTIVDHLYQSNRNLSDHLAATGEISYQADVEAAASKALLLSAASYFEHKVCELLVAFALEHSMMDAMLTELVRQRVIKRQYYTYFDWDSNNANKFFAMFGEPFKAHMRGKITADPALEDAIKSFIELGRLRNELVHQNFAVFPLNKTMDEVNELFQKARQFVDMLPMCLRELEPDQPDFTV